MVTSQLLEYAIYDVIFLIRQVHTVMETPNMFHQWLSGFCVSIRTVSLAVWLLMVKATGKGFTK